MISATTRPLRDVIHARNDIVHPRDNPTGIATFVGLEHIEPQTGRRIGAVPIDLESMTGRKARFLPGDIVYGYLRPYLNKVWIAEFAGFCSVDQYVFVINEAIADAEYVASFLRSPAYLAAAPIDETPGQLPRIRIDEVLSTPIPLPPLDEQRRIAARLREQVAEIGRVASAAQARIDEMNGLAQRAIDAAIPASDAIALGHALRTSLRTGLSRAASTTANHKVLTLSSVRNGNLDVGQNRPMDATDAEALANAVRPSTFYVVRGNGSLHMAGAGALSPESSEAAVLYPDLLIQVDPDPALLSVEYLALAWRAYRVRRQVEMRLRTSAGIHKINLANLSTVEVPTPPIDEQRTIVARLREQLAETDRAKAALAAQREAIDALPAALLREVFGPVHSLGGSA